MSAGDLDVEVAVVGGGLVGATLAATLAVSGVETAVIDREDPRTVLDAGFDGRASAVAAGARHMLDAVGLWDAIAPHAQPIGGITVSDGKVDRPESPLKLGYDSREVGEPFGHIVENRELRRAQQRFLGTCAKLAHLAPVGVARVDRRPEGATVHLDDGRRVRARLVAACDGRGSRLRQAAGIEVRTWRYDEAAIVATLRHDRPHRGMAYEHFLPTGPFAMLPMVPDSDGTPRSSIVWTETRELADRAVEMPDAVFAEEIYRRFGHRHGAVAPTGPRFRYPLSGLHAQSYTARRLALVGDAAHAVHPIAGQGLNMGWRDVAALAECVVEQRRLGLDVGSPEVLRRYARWRGLDNTLLVMATDGLNRLFANDRPPVRAARDLGLAAVDRADPLKRVFMRHAMGMLGDLPRLLRGRSL